MLTHQQISVLSFVDGYMKRHGIAPTQTEIADGIGVRYNSTAAHHINTLRREGYLNGQARIPRSTTITRKGKTALAKSRKD